MASGGLAFMLVSMVSSVLVITDYLLNRWVAVTLTVVTGAWFLIFWVILPFVRRNWGEDDGDALIDDAPTDASPSP
jgi:hypothetical protein